MTGKQRGPTHVTVSPLRMPPSRLQGCDAIMEYAPDDAYDLRAWLAQLPAKQCRRVWKALLIEQWQDVNLSAVVAMLEVVDDRLISVEKVGDNGIAHEH